jgi:hypothetical protein
MTWLDRAITEIVVAEETDVVRVLELLEAAGSGSSLTNDAQIAALAIRHQQPCTRRIPILQRFAGVRWHDPIA